MKDKTNILSRIVIALLLALGGLTAQAAGTINGMLVDAADTSELIAASVKLVKAQRDSAYVAGTTTDSHGVFNLKGVAPGRYVIKFSYLGYESTQRRVTVGSDRRDVNLGPIALTPAGKMLGEVVVNGVKTPITVKMDTVEYNADSYKTQANAVVEDLLKRMPGVEVSSDGKITANGKEVKKILIDGKEFFSDDPTVASKNIPADMINKLQVIDRKSDLARLTGVDDGEDETVINLTVKKGMNNGWFGTASAGYGTDDRWGANLMANYFSNGNQFTLMGGGNNTNNMGFTDQGAGRFQRFGGSNGITTSQNAGFNFNVGTHDSERFRAGGNVFYSHSKRDVRSTANRQYIFPDSTSYYASRKGSVDKGHNVRGDFRLLWKPDTLNTLEFRPNFSINISDSYSTDSSMTRAGDALLTPVNRSLSSYKNHGKSYDFAGQLIYSHNFKSHPGRSYSAQLRYAYSSTDEDGGTYTRNTYYLKSDPDETIDQIYDNNRPTNSVNGRVTWTEPLGSVRNARFITFAYRGSYKRSRADKSVYDITRDSVPATAGGTSAPMMATLLRSQAYRNYMADTYDPSVLTDLPLLEQLTELELGPEASRTFNEDLSNRFRNTYYDQSFEIGFRQIRKKYTMNVGVALNSAMSKSTDLINPDRNIAARWVWTVAPFARLRYRFSKTRNLNVFYRARSSQPSLTQLQPVADRSNPLAVVVGNPELKPTFTHRINVRYGDFNQQAQRSIMAMLNMSVVQNEIISKTTYDATTGGRTTTYDNISGVWNAMGMNMVSFPFTSSKVMYFTNNVFLRFSQAKGYNNGQVNTSRTFSVNESPGLAFRNGTFDLELRPRYSFQTTHNSVKTVSSRDIHTYGGQFNGTYSSPFGLVLSTDLTYSATSGYSSGYNTKQWLWNASVGFEFLRGRQASLQLSVFDILNQRKNVSRSVTASYISDASYNSLGRYGMVTFTYRFSTFKKGQEPENKGFGGDRRGPGGPGGRPMGPPPGGGRRSF